MDANKIETMKALALAATPQNFDSAQIKHIGGWTDCPTCGGDGAVSIDYDYCNYDNAALGVQFYGIGDEHVKAEAYYRAANPAAVLELIAEVERLTCELQNQREITQHWKASAGYVSAHAAGTVKDAGWIDLKKDKPMDWQRVLVALDSGAVVEGYRGSAGWHWGETDEPQDGDANAAYWMPWPESPVAAMEATKAGKDNA